MKKDKLSSLPVSLAIIYVPFSLMQGHYYLDPGTGSLLIQLAIGAVVGGWYVIKNYWVRIKLFFTKLFNIGSKHENPQD